MIRRSSLPLLLVLLVLAAFGSTARAEKAIHVTSNGWHTGIVIARADLPPGLIPETADFPAATHFEFGWGNRDYYTTPRKTIGLTIGAALPGAAVVHMAGLARAPYAYPGHEAVALRISDDGFRRLAAYLHQSFARGGAPRGTAITHGLVATSAFYPATGTFHLFNTCNTWTAMGLASAGLSIRASGVQQAEELMSQVRALAARRSRGM